MKNRRMPSTQKHVFSQVPKAQIQRSQFDRSHGLKTNFNAGFLFPIFVDEALPGDSFNLKMTGLSRMATPIFPIMDNAYMSTFFFAVPNRLLWDNWEKFNGQQDNPEDSTDFLIPQINAPVTTGWQIGSMGDFFGLPTGIPGFSTSALPFRAYNLIYNEWFRDQNIQDSLVVPTGDGPDLASNYIPQRRGKRHDYFTSALPFPQKGDAVNLPLGETAPVLGIGTDASAVYLNRPTDIRQSDGTTVNWPGGETDTSDNAIYVQENPDFQNFPGIYADLTQATAATINSLRQAFQVQRMLERDARGGTRYTEVIRAHFGVTSPDARLQRPEYLGGGVSPLQIQPVASTVPSLDQEGSGVTAPQGTLSGVGTVMINNHGFNKSFTEHCTIIGLVCVHADLTYQQGIERMWSRRTRYDFYWPALAHLGEQAVLNKEIYAQGTEEDEGVFGYQERYAEYRYKPSRITGLFRSEAPGSLDAWHLAQDFENIPRLNEDFITEDPPFKRVIAVPSEPDFILDCYFKFKCARPMPLYGVPGLIDHF